jgi:hypothetical protein
MTRRKVDMNNGASSALMLFLSGLGTGIAFALLVAPRNGPATRRLIVRKAKEGEGWLKRKATETNDYVKNTEAELNTQINQGGIELS